MTIDQIATGGNPLCIAQRNLPKGLIIMPMDFPDMKSLEIAARVHKFRPKYDREAEEQYRAALADHVKPVDRIESFEIRFGVGWDKWTDEQNRKSFFG